MKNKVPMTTRSPRSGCEAVFHKLARSLRWSCGPVVLAVALAGCGGGSDGALTSEAQAQREQTAAIVQAQQSATQLMSAVVQPGSGTENFEAGMGDWQNWGNAQVVAGAGTSGSNALQVGPGAGGAALHVPNVTGTTYRLTAQVRVTDPVGGPATLGVDFYNASRARIVGTRAFPNVTNTAFAPFTYEVQAPAGTAYALVWVWKNGSTGFAYVDDVAFGPASVAPAPPDSNLLSNGGFEAGMSDWVDWGNTHILNAPVNSGALALSAGPAAGGAGHNVDGIVPGTTYRLVAQAKVSDPSADRVFVGVNFLDEAGSVVGATQLSTTSTRYTGLSGDIIAPPRAVRAVVYVWKNAGGVGYVDDFAFGVVSGSAPPLNQVSPNLVANGQLFGLSGWVNWGNAAGTGSSAGGAQVGTDAGGFGQNVGGILPGETYRLSANVKVSTAGETGYLGLKFVDSAGNSLQDQLAPFSSTAVSSAQVQLVAPANAVGALVYVWKNAGSGFALVDNVTLVQLGSTAPPPPVVQLSGSPQERLDADGLATHKGQSITRLGNGNYVAAWVATNGDPGLAATLWQVCFQRLDANLARLGPNACVTDAQATTQPTQVLARPNGGFVIVWSIIESVSSGTMHYAERSQAFDAAGNAIGGIQDGPQQPVPSTAAALTGGGYVAVSAAVGNPVPPSVSNLSFQRYSADGTPIGSPTSVGDKGGLSGARVVPLAGGGFAVAWNGAGPAPAVYTRTFTADGTPVGEPVLAGGVTLFCSTSGCPFQYLVGLSPMDDGGYLVLWGDGFGRGSPGGTFARRFKADGSPGAAKGQVRTTGQPAPAGPDGFVLVWAEDGGDGGPAQSMMQRYDATPLR
jgi:hypothetical protein